MKVLLNPQVSRPTNLSLGEVVACLQTLVAAEVDPEFNLKGFEKVTHIQVSRLLKLPSVEKNHWRPQRPLNQLHKNEGRVKENPRGDRGFDLDAFDEVKLWLQLNLSVKIFSE